MRLEQAAAPGDCGTYPFVLEGAEIDLRPMLLQIFQETIGGEEVGLMSARFHATVARAFATGIVVRNLRKRSEAAAGVSGDDIEIIL